MLESFTRIVKTGYLSFSGMLSYSHSVVSAHVNINTVSAMKRNTQRPTRYGTLASINQSIYMSNAAESATSPSSIRSQSTSLNQPD